MKPRKVHRLSHDCRCCSSGWRTQAAFWVIILKANKDTCAKTMAKQFLWLLQAAYSSPISTPLHYSFRPVCLLLCSLSGKSCECAAGGGVACTLTWTGPSLIKILPLAFYFVASLRFNFWHWPDSFHQRPLSSAQLQFQLQLQVQLLFRLLHWLWFLHTGYGSALDRLAL